MSKHPAYSHELTDDGQPIHADIDPFIPTGTCAICADIQQETEPPEERVNDA